MLALFLIISTLAARADEGFGTAPPPAALVRAWDATVLLYSGTTDVIEVASAVVVRQDSAFTYLLTAGHALADHTRIFQTLRMKWSDRNNLNRASDFTDFEVVAKDAHLDLALLRVRTTLAVAPVDVSTGDDSAYAPAFAVGFPVTADRKVVNNITDPEILTRRWSAGHVIRTVAITPDSIYFGERAGAVPGLATTVDAMPGSSGGPLVGADGKLIGIVVRTNISSGDSEYQGRGRAESSQINAVAVPAAVVRAFLSEVLK